MDAAEQSGQRPVILVCCAIADARNSVAEELERRYSADYRIASAGSALQATTALRDSAEHGEKVALLLADQPTGMSDDGALFAEARRLFPDVRRGALIEWGFWGDRATTGSVLQLMAAGRIDYYVICPWHSPGEYFHRTVTEFLLEWERAIGDRPREVTVIGDDTQPRTHELRSRLARGGVPHAYASPETEGGRRMLAESGVAYEGVPLVRLLDGRIISDPRDAELARAYGLTTELPADEEVDVAIVGAGPAGLAAAVYAASEGLRSLVVERESIGGQAGSSSLIRNYLGFSRGISGSELAARAYQQAWVFGAGFVHSREAVGIQSSDGGFLLTVAPGEQVRARSVVIAVGVSYRRLTVADLAAYVGVCRRIRLLRRICGRGSCTGRADRARCWRWELCGPGGAPSRTLCGAGQPAGAWQDAGGQHVEVPHRPAGGRRRSRCDERRSCRRRSWGSPRSPGASRS